MNNLFRSATITLTFWYLAMAMVISLLFSGVVYHIANDELAQSLRNQTARIYRAYPVFTGDPFFVRDNDSSLGSRHILQNLIYANAAVLVGAGLGSYWLAKRTLQPIAEANERQKRFVADASHELRTPLTALHMETEVALMDKSAGTKALRSALTSNLEEAGKLEHLLESLLDLSKLDADAASTTFKRLNIQQVVSTAVERTAVAANMKQISVDTKPAEQLYVMGDEGSLVQLLTILLDNAIKYSPSDSTVILTTKQVDHEVHIIVSDSGIGIEPEALNHVFDRFYRADKARSAGNGFGLGLSIAKHIADIHNGTIIIRSKVGKGTTAVVSLPLASDQSA